jgi:hypothetical protein
MDFQGKAERLADIDIPRIGHRIGVGEDEIHAVMDVEARSSGFDGAGRPAMLFEPHIFWRQLGPGAAREAAARAGLAYASWGAKPYPKDSYPRLEAAMGIEENAALRSCSWGLGQIMGFNAELAGYQNASAMVEAFKDSETAQMDAMVRFIEAAGLDDELRRHDWAGFARGYNGPGYAKHGYDRRLAERFRWWQGKPDTPWSPASMGCACPHPDEVVPG